MLHFSRRSAATYVDCAAAAGITEPALAPVHYCLSQQVAEPLAAAGARADPGGATAPNEAALIGLINESERVDSSRSDAPDLIV